MELNQEPEVTVLQPEGHLGLEQASLLLKTIRAAKGDLEFNLAKVDLVEVSILQVILVSVASMRRRGRVMVIRDSDSGILRSTLLLAGIKPELAGLSPSLTL